MKLPGHTVKFSVRATQYNSRDQYIYSVRPGKTAVRSFVKNSLDKAIRSVVNSRISAPVYRASVTRVNQVIYRALKAVLV